MRRNKKRDSHEFTNYGPPQSPKGDFDYVLLLVATNSRIVGPLNPPGGKLIMFCFGSPQIHELFFNKNTLYSPLYWRGVGGEAFHEKMMDLFSKCQFPLWGI